MEKRIIELCMMTSMISRIAIIKREINLDSNNKCNLEGERKEIEGDLRIIVDCKTTENCQCVVAVKIICLILG